MSRIIAIDPGRKKCGLILADLQTRQILEGRVVDESIVLRLIDVWIGQNSVEKILLGNGTSSQDWKKLLDGLASIDMVDEKGTTFRARQRYWELWPPSIWIRWIPRGMILPSDNLDAVAALLLLEDYFNQKFSWEDSPNFKTLLVL